MVISRKESIPSINLVIYGLGVEQVKNFVYLGQLITEDCRSDMEIK